MCGHTAKKIHDQNINLEDLKNLPYLEARKKLLDFSGVGLKVADCVLLFSLRKLEAFPVDVWVKRVILNHYSDQLPEHFVKKLQSHTSLTNGEYQKIGDFARTYFGAYAGYAQEYLYPLRANTTLKWKQTAIPYWCASMSEGKIEELIKHKRIFLRQTTADYSAGGNDMLDDVDSILKDAKAEIAHNLELVNCLRKDEGEQA